MRKVVWLHGTSSVVHVGSGDKIRQIKDTLSTLLTPHALAQKSRNRVSVTFVRKKLPVDPWELSAE